MEAIATVVRNSSLAVGGTVDLTSVMNINGTDVTSNTITLTITGVIDKLEDIDPQVNDDFHVKCRDQVHVVTYVVRYSRENYRQ